MSRMVTSETGQGGAGWSELGGETLPTDTTQLEGVRGWIVARWLATKRWLGWTDVPPPENKTRGNWDSEGQFCLATLGFSVGLLNVWRFPGLLFRHGGPFLLVYWLGLVTLSAPLGLLEAGLGQFSSLSPGETWPRLAPVLAGLGVGQVIHSALWAAFYSVQVSYALFLGVAGIGSPWQRCQRKNYDVWPPNSRLCYTLMLAERCRRRQHGFWAKGTCHTASTASDLLRDLQDCLHLPSSPYRKPFDPKTWHCSFRLKLLFNASSPAKAFKRPALPPCVLGTGLLSRRGIDNLGSTGLQSMSKELWSQTDKEDPPTPWMVDLAHRGSSSVDSSKFVEKSKCLWDLLGPSTGALQELLERQAAATWPKEEGLLIRRTLDLDEVLSSEEFAASMGGAGPAAAWRPGGNHGGLITAFLATWTLIGMLLLDTPRFDPSMVYRSVGLPLVATFCLFWHVCRLEGGPGGMWATLSRGWAGGEAFRSWELWLDGLSQALTSCGVGLGGIHTLASFNRFRQGFAVELMATQAVGGLFSLLYALTVLGLGGVTAHRMGIEPAEAMRGSGMWLSWLTPAQGTIALDGGEALCCLLGVIAFAVGLAPLLTTLHVMIVAVEDRWSRPRKTKRNKAPLAGYQRVLRVAACILVAIPGFFLLNDRGLALAVTLGDAVTLLPILVITLLTVVGLTWMYGRDQLLSDLFLISQPIPSTSCQALGTLSMVPTRSETEREPSEASLVTAYPLRSPTKDADRFSHASAFFFVGRFRWVLVMAWGVVCPVLLLGTLCLALMRLWLQYKTEDDGRLWTYCLRLVLSFAPLLAVLVGGAVKAVQHHVFRRERPLRTLLQPLRRWGPAIYEHRRGTDYDRRLNPEVAFRVRSLSHSSVVSHTAARQDPHDPQGTLQQLDEQKQTASRLPESQRSTGDGGRRRGFLAASAGGSRDSWEGAGMDGGARRGFRPASVDSQEEAKKKPSPFRPASVEPTETDPSPAAAGGGTGHRSGTPKRHSSRPAASDSFGPQSTAGQSLGGSQPGPHSPTSQHSARSAALRPRPRHSPAPALSAGNPLDNP